MARPSTRRWGAATALTLAASPAAAANLVTNGDFENNTGVGQIAPATQNTSNSGNPVVPIGTSIGQTLTGWLKTCLKDCGSDGFAFVVDANADSTGFQSVFSYPAIKVWGPDSGSENGFTGSPNGGNFVGIDGDYGQSKITQTINGLVPNTTYNLAFEWAGSQFTDASGATTQWWQVDFGSSNAETSRTAVDSKGFSGWLQATMTFVAAATSQDLSFTAFGTPGGQPPFLLLDAVSLTEGPPPPAKVPAPLPVFGAAAALGWSGRLRRRLRRSRPGQPPQA